MGLVGQVDPGEIRLLGAIQRIDVLPETPPAVSPTDVVAKVSSNTDVVAVSFQATDAVPAGPKLREAQPMVG